MRRWAAAVVLAAAFGLVVAVIVVAALGGEGRTADLGALPSVPTEEPATTVEPPEEPPTTEAATEEESTEEPPTTDDQASTEDEESTEDEAATEDEASTEDEESTEDEAATEDEESTEDKATPTPGVDGSGTFSLVDGTMSETFDGAPAAPTPWSSDFWDITVLSRDVETFDELEPMDAGHGPDCAGPPAHHQVALYDDTVFQCRDHMMTSIKAKGFGGVFLTPAAMVDFSAGEGVVRVDVSTLITSDRDYWDVWITPFEANVQMPSQLLNGMPRDGVRLRLNTADEQFEGSVFVDGDEIGLPEETSAGYSAVLTPDAARRDTFEITISRDHLTIGMPDYGIEWVNAELPELDWSQGVVQFAHHSYNPKKAKTPADAHANTWHWDNVEIAPAVPFTIIGSTPRQAGGDEAPASITFDEPAPAGAWLRFAGIGDDLEFSTDGGASWEEPDVQWTSDPEGDEHFKPYWTEIPEGTTEIHVRAEDWWGGPWLVRDFSIWAPPSGS
jgi:hypothetical protein